MPLTLQSNARQPVKYWLHARTAVKPRRRIKLHNKLGALVR